MRGFPKDDDDQRLLELYKAGVDFSKPYKVDFWFVVPNKRSGEELLALLINKGFDCKLQGFFIPLTCVYSGINEKKPTLNIGFFVVVCFRRKRNWVEISDICSSKVLRRDCWQVVDKVTGE